MSLEREINSGATSIGIFPNQEIKAQKLKFHIHKIKQFWDKRKQQLENSISECEIKPNQQTIQGEYLLKDERDTKARQFKSTHFHLGFQKKFIDETTTKSTFTPLAYENHAQSHKQKQNIRIHSNSHIQLGNSNDPLQSSSKYSYNLKSLPQHANSLTQIKKKMKKTNFAFGLRKDDSQVYNPKIMFNQSSSKELDDLPLKLSNQQAQSKSQDRLTMRQRMALQEEKLNLEKRRLRMIREKTNVLSYSKKNDDASLYQSQSNAYYEEKSSNSFMDNYNHKVESLNQAGKSHFHFGSDKKCNYSTIDDRNSSMSMHSFDTPTKSHKMNHSIKASGTFMPKRNLLNHFKTVTQDSFERSPQQNCSQQYKGKTNKEIFIENQQLTHQSHIYLATQDTKDSMMSVQKQSFQDYPTQQLTLRQVKQNLQLQNAQNHQALNRSKYTSLMNKANLDIKTNEEDNKKHIKIQEYLNEASEIHREAGKLANTIQTESGSSHFKMGFESSRAVSLDQRNNQSETKNKFVRYERETYMNPAFRCISESRDIKGLLRIRQTGQQDNQYKTINQNMEQVVSKFSLITKSKEASRNILVNNQNENSRSHFSLGMRSNPFRESSIQTNTHKMLNQSVSLTTYENSPNMKVTPNAMRDHVAAVFKDRPTTSSNLKTCNSDFYRWIQPVPSNKFNL